MTVEERAKDCVKGMGIGDDLYLHVLKRVEQVLRDQIEDCVKKCDEQVAIHKGTGNMTFEWIARHCSNAVRALAAPKEEKPDDNQPDDRFDLWGFECNEKQED